VDNKSLIVNDIYSQLNPTRVAEIVSVDSLEALQAAVHRAARQSQAMCTAGGRHAMGIRFIIWLSFYRGPWWMGGSIPIFFHWVLAGFILLVGSYHWFNSRTTEDHISA
jgi:hypothetical protein